MGPCSLRNILQPARLWEARGGEDGWGKWFVGDSGDSPRKYWGDSDVGDSTNTKCFVGDSNVGESDGLWETVMWETVKTQNNPHIENIPGEKQATQSR